MGLVKSRGNMYEWVDAHWNPIKGECQHHCDYCYVEHSRAKKFYSGVCRLDEKDLETNLGHGRKIFIGSMNDMWGDWVPERSIASVITRCVIYPCNTYVFQSKNPRRFYDYLAESNRLWGTTIETDKYPSGFRTMAPPIFTRVDGMRSLDKKRRFVTIEPIMDFDLNYLLYLISSIAPEFVTIGADSKRHNLVEPSWDKVQALIRELSRFTEIRQKTNLGRLKK